MPRWWKLQLSISTRYLRYSKVDHNTTTQTTMQTTKLALSVLALGAASSFAALVWTVGDSAAAARQAPETLEPHSGSSGTTTFVQEGGPGPTNSLLPGNPASPATNQQADDDFYFAGNYANQVDGGAGLHPTAGIVAATEAGVERAVTGGDTTNRYPLQFPGIGHTATDVFTVSFAMLDLNDNDTGTGQYDFAISASTALPWAMSVTPQERLLAPQFTSDAFTLADVGGTAGAPDDNYVQLELGATLDRAARWSNFDYIQMDRTAAVPEPSSTGLALLSLAGLGLIRRRK